MNIVALVDCNSFYASCETIFKPHLNKKPIVVLSNNDGCVIARSSEAKKLGIKMGVPFFEIKQIIKARLILKESKYSNAEKIKRINYYVSISNHLSHFINFVGRRELGNKKLVK